jgi:hypothetical protein
MKLRVILFNQHWFHLCAAAEAIVSESKRFEEVEVIFARKGLKLWPLDLHYVNFIRWLGRYSPEFKLYRYLDETLPHNDVKVTFSNLKIQRKTSATWKSDSSELPMNFSELRKFRIKGHPVGMAISSYLITRTRSSYPMTKKYFNLIKKGYFTYFQIQDALVAKNLSNKTDEVWLCNGRQLHERSVVEFCKTNNITYSFFEIGGDGNQLARWILHASSPHDRVDFQNEIKEHYFNKQQDDGAETDNWFLRNRSHKSNQFIDNQVTGKSLGQLDPFVVFFTSSDDEVAAISEDWDSPWGSQIEAAQSLIDSFKTRSGDKLIIRVHPNLLNKNKYDQKLWTELQVNPNVTIVSASSDVDSYALLDESRGVLTFGSTIGVEAVFSGKPLGLLSHARYDEIVENTYLPTSNQLVKWLDDAFQGSLVKPSTTGAKMWAYYSLTGGHQWYVTQIKQFRRRKIGILNGNRMRPNSVLVAAARTAGRLRSITFEQNGEFLFWRFRPQTQQRGD